MLVSRQALQRGEPTRTTKIDTPQNAPLQVTFARLRVSQNIFSILRSSILFFPFSSQHIRPPGEKQAEAPVAGASPDAFEVASPYTVFTRPAIRVIVALVGVAMLFSPLSANIYFPAMDQLQDDLDVSAQQINLTITSYLVFQAIAPALFGNAADIIGRRPSFLVMFAIYTAANIGLALQSTYAALLGQHRGRLRRDC